MGHCNTAIALGIALLVSAPARADEADTAPTAGLAGTGAANAVDNGAIRRSPAAMALSETYAARVDAGLGPGGLDAGWRLGASLRDSRTSALGAGFSYTRHRSNPDPNDADGPGWILPGTELSNETTEESFRLGLGYGALGRRLGIGAGGVYDRRKSELSGETTGFELDASLAGRPDPNGRVVISVTGYDLTPWGDRDPSGEAGVWWTATPYFGVAADAVWTGTSWGGRFGLRGGIADVVLLGAGAEWTGESQELAGSVGVTAEGAALEYALAWDLLAESSPLAHTLGLSIAF